MSKLIRKAHRNFCRRHLKVGLPKRIWQMNPLVWYAAMPGRHVRDGGMNVERDNRRAADKR